MVCMIVSDIVSELLLAIVSDVNCVQEELQIT